MKYLLLALSLVCAGCNSKSGDFKNGDVVRIKGSATEWIVVGGSIIGNEVAVARYDERVGGFINRESVPSPLLEKIK